MYILGIDTSCDDTSAAITHQHTIISNVVSSQISLHQPYGGVFPTVAKLAHQQNIAPIVTIALKKAKITPSQLSAVAVTYGPGLAPALEIGIQYAQEFSHQHQLPLIGINHLEGHLLSPLLTRQSRSSSHALTAKPTFPFLGIIISGGHSLFVQVDNYGQYQILGETLDDAAGECLDKIGRLLNLGYPAAPVLEQFAKKGDPHRFRYPLPLTTHRNFNLSFSGLKTHAHHLIQQLQKDNLLDQQTFYDLCASTQTGVFKHLNYKLNKLLTQLPHFSCILVGGGVAANMTLRKNFRQLAKTHHLSIYFPYSRKLCGDNAAMIAYAGSFHFLYQHFSPNLDRQPNLKLESWR